jgi:purine-binding chemotaxis protein CheW
MTARTGAEGERRLLVTFRVGDHLFAADVVDVERVLRYEVPSALPNVPAWLAGVIDYRGRVVPVVDLRTRFELPAAPPAPGARTLVISVSGEWMGAVVDAVLDVVPVAADAVVSPPPVFRGLAAEYVRGIARRGDRHVVLLDVGRLLSATERLALAKSVETAGSDAPADAPADARADTTTSEVVEEAQRE